MPPFPALEGGCVLSATIDRYAWGTLQPRDDEAICINSLDFGISLQYSSRRDLKLDGNIDLAKAAIHHLAGPDEQGFRPLPALGRAARARASARRRR